MKAVMYASFYAGIICLILGIYARFIHQERMLVTSRAWLITAGVLVLICIATGLMQLVKQSEQKKGT